MIKMRYVSDGYEKYVSCNSCCKSYKYDQKMVRLSVQSGYGFGMIIYLCDDCKKQLKEIIND